MLPRVRIRAFIATVAVALLIVACREITAPERSQKLSGTVTSLQNPSGLVVVYPDSMRGWVFYNDQTNAVCPTGSACRMVQGPATPPLGSGSAELYDSLSTDGKALILADYAGTRFDQITDLHYSTYRQTANTGNNLAISLQFNVDYDLSDAASGYQGRLVYEPYTGIGGNVPRNTWQTWDAKAGKWWGTKATVMRNGGSVTNPCVQSTPCTWAQVLAAFPNVGVHSLYGAVVLKAGSGWPGFRGNIDSLAIGVGGTTTLFDFESAAPPVVPSTPPDSIPVEYRTFADTIRVPATYAGLLMRQFAVVEFNTSATAAERQTAISSVGGVVAGGLRDGGPTGGLFLIRVPADSSGTLLLSAIARLKSFPQVAHASVDFVGRNALGYRRPNFAFGQRRGNWTTNSGAAFGSTNRAWALNAIGAPSAWGCTVGDSTIVGVVDIGIHVGSQLTPNLKQYSSLVATNSVRTHGTEVSSLIAARGSATYETGLMWNARLVLADMATTDSGETFSMAQVAYASRKAIYNGARVINLSVQFWEYGSTLSLTAPHTSQQDATRGVWSSWSKRAATLSPLGVRPLWVVVAGNEGAPSNTYWNSSTAIADSLPTETIIVAGAGWHAGALWQGSTMSGNIDIAAPAELVPTYTGTDTTSSYGTSFAAPLVTGTAGLLFSFDPTITASEAKQHIVGGAVAGGRVASGSGGTYPVLNAYEALRKAAAKNGAPLCGNRVWADPGYGIRVQRDTNSIQTIVAPSGAFDPWSFNYVNIHHGGRRMELAFSDRYVLGGGGTWGTGTWSPDLVSEYSGAYKGSSAYYQDHDDSLNTKFVATPAGSTYSLKIEYRALPGNTLFHVDSIANAVTISTASASVECNQREPDAPGGVPTGSYSCLTYDTTGVWEQRNFIPTNVGHTLEPQARVAVAALGIWTHYRQLDASWSVCAGQGGALFPKECKGRVVDSLHTSRVHLWKVDRSGNWEQLNVPSIANDSAEVWGMAINEAGTELMLQVGRYHLNARTGSWSCADSRHEWIALDVAGSSSGATRYRRNIGDPEICDGAYDSAANGASLRALRQPSHPDMRSLMRPD